MQAADAAAYWANRIGVDRWRRALNPRRKLSKWERLRLLLLVPWRSPWNRWLRNWTARCMGYRDFEDEVYEGFEDLLGRKPSRSQRRRIEPMPRVPGPDYPGTPPHGPPDPPPNPQ